MERLWRQMIGMLFLGLTACTGCHHLARYCPWAEPELPPAGPVCKVVATWNNTIVYTPDPVNGGAPTPGLAGRVYLFDQTIGHPLAGDGSLVVDLYQVSPDLDEGKPVMLEQWRLDAATMKRLLRKDTIGWGYTLFLPWGTYQPAIGRVVLKVSYQPAKGGTALYADTTLLTLQTERKSRVSATAAANRPVPATDGAPVATSTTIGKPPVAASLPAPVD